jgi:hypothetical protein
VTIELTSRPLPIPAELTVAMGNPFSSLNHVRAAAAGVPATPQSRPPGH